MRTIKPVYKPSICLEDSEQTSFSHTSARKTLSSANSILMSLWLETWSTILFAVQHWRGGELLSSSNWTPSHHQSASQVHHQHLQVGTPQDLHAVHLGLQCPARSHLCRTEVWEGHKNLLLLYVPGADEKSRYVVVIITL